MLLGPLLGALGLTVDVLEHSALAFVVEAAVGEQLFVVIIVT